MEEILAEPVSLDPTQILHQVRVRVRETVGKIDLIVRLSELVGEGQCVIAASEAVTLPFEAVLAVVDGGTDAVPGQLVGPVATVLREAQHTHAIIVQGVRFS